MGRKLSTKTLTCRQRDAIDEVMDEFDFSKVERHMIQADWGWATGEKDEEGYPELKIPSNQELRVELRNMLVDAFNRMNAWKEEEAEVHSPVYSSCGGFTVYVWPSDECQAFFSVADWWVDSDMLDKDE